MEYLVLDVGGSAIKYALMNDELEFLEKGQVPTPKTSLEDFKKEVQNLYQKYQERVDGIAMSLPGLINKKTNKMQEIKSEIFRKNGGRGCHGQTIGSMIRLELRVRQNCNRIYTGKEHLIYEEKESGNRGRRAEGSCPGKREKTPCKRGAEGDPLGSSGQYGAFVSSDSR